MTKLLTAPSGKRAIRQSIAYGVRLLAVLGLMFSSLAIAEPDPVFTVRGFGTLGAARTTSENVEFVRDISQPRGARSKWDGRTDSVLGLQANWRIDPQLEAVVQGVSRYRYDRTFTPEIAWAYLKYDPTPALSLRGGRLGTEFFMLADSRLVGYSYLTVRPPGDFFWYLPFYSIDGADAMLTLPLGEHVLRGKVFYGISDGNIPLADRQWKIDGSPLMGAYLEYQHDAWLMRLSYANIKFHNSLPIVENFNSIPSFLLSPAAVQASLDYLETADTRSHYYSLGLVYDRGPWQLQFMLNRVDQGSNAFQSSNGGYLLAGYRIGPVTPFFGYSWVDSDRRGNTMNFAVARVMADSRAEQHTTLAGLRWDVLRNIALKAQWDGIRGDSSSIFPYRRELAGWDGKLDVFSLTLDFVF
ncbi:hypothetical protein [Dechloromonas sp. A34]|uniref:hypothetical protein n=1 Tax=Dechloromonas sp. A34 TaxID=447588 RepID=UPI002248AF3A|nr:hypothetical protein [Dechloromonas sp. A34]